MTEQQISTTTRYDGAIFAVTTDIVRLPDSSDAFRDIVHHNGGVCVLPLHEDGTVTLVKQYRYATQQALLEIPAGKLEKGEEPQACAIRELREEVGLKAKNIELLTVIYPTGGYSTEQIYIYLATDLTFVGQQLDEGELLEVFNMPLDELVAMTLRNEIPDAKTALAVLITNEKKRGTQP